MIGPGKIEDDRRNVEFFTELLARHKISPLSLNWGSRESQELRFAVLAAIGLKAGSSVLDVGCGVGDFYAWQLARGLKLAYGGIDIAPAMVHQAAERFPGVPFRALDVSEENPGDYDFVVASGIFYLRRHQPFEFMKATVSNLFSRCRQGLAFNSLSAWASPSDKEEFRADPLETLKFCQTLTPWVQLRHDYHPGDFTIYLRRRHVQA